MLLPMVKFSSDTAILKTQSRKIGLTSAGKIVGSMSFGSFSSSADSLNKSSLSLPENSSRALCSKGDFANVTEAPKKRTSRRDFILNTLLCCLQGNGMN